ncbi:hypothetical protein [Azorhizobium oxalatiphilum]|uniref:hypothetical protein n=1 Tax=Azorhizobium oxalatiphilum TaxID=980631 RepID=UPI00166E75FD|nr:hypothetical protein [Azorhizobium oxalatiphilum]
MRLSVATISDGLHPLEAVVGVNTTEGSQRLVVSRRAINQNSIEVGLIRKDGDRTLVELPRETQTGEWRVWVNSSQLILEKVPA